MRLTSFVVWCMIVLGITKLTAYSYDQVMKQVAQIQHTYASIGDQLGDPDIQQTTRAIGSLGH